MAYKVIKRKHFLTNKFIYRIVNTGAKGSQIFGVNKNFNSEKEAEEYMNKGSHHRRF